MSTILFPTDFSATADHAFIYALHLADKLQADIITVHAFQRPIIRGASHYPSTLERFHEEFDIYEFENYRDNVPHLDELASANGLSHIQVRHSMIEGDPKEVILSQAKKETVDFIVLGTTGASGLREIFMGSVAGEVLENASCPVLSVPAKSEFDGKIDQMALAFSYQPEEEEALHQLMRIADAFGAEIHCINVDLAHTESYNKRMERYRQSYSQHANIHFHVVEGDQIEESISTFVEKNHIDLLAMVSHQRNFLQELFHYSHAKKMSYHSKVPVLSFPNAVQA